MPFLSLSEGIEEMRPALDAAYARVMASGVFIGAKELARFEDSFATACGAAHAVGTGNGQDALTLTLRALDIGPGDNVITPCHTFIATWLAISATGAAPVAVDVDAANRTLTAELVEAAMTPATRAVIAVHIHGQPVDMDPILDLCKPRSIAVIEDAAQAHGAAYKGRPVGSLGDAAAFSFYPTKNLGAFGDGGCVTTDDGELAARVRRLGNYGAAEKDLFTECGANSRLDELQAAFLGVRLEYLERWNASRAGIAARYLDELASLPLTLPDTPPWAQPAWHQFVIRHPRRGDLAAYLAQRGIGTLIHYPVPPHLQAAYEGLPTAPGGYPVSEAIARECLSLPIWPQLTDPMVDQVIDAVGDFLAQA